MSKYRDTLLKLQMKEKSISLTATARSTTARAGLSPTLNVEGPPLSVLLLGHRQLSLEADHLPHHLQGECRKLTRSKLHK